MSEEHLSTNRVGLVGRNKPEEGYEDDPTENVRALAPLRNGAKVRHLGMGATVATVQVFRSEDDEDRGGVVIRMSLSTEEPEGFLPWARNIRSGVEVHMAGEREAVALLDALRVALALPENGRTTVENQKGTPR